MPTYQFYRITPITGCETCPLCVLGNCRQMGIDCKDLYPKWCPIKEIKKGG